MSKLNSKLYKASLDQQGKEIKVSLQRYYLLIRRLLIKSVQSRLLTSPLSIACFSCCCLLPTFET